MNATQSATPEAELTAVPDTRVAPRWIRWVCGVFFALAALNMFMAGLPAAREVQPDFEYFYKGGATLLERGSLDRGIERVPGGGIERRGTIEWYLPFVSRMMTIPALLPPQVAGIVWLCLNVLMMLTTLRVVGQHLMDLPKQDWMVVQLVPFLILVSAWSWEFRLNQINNLTLLLIVASFVHWRQGHRDAAGLWIGLAVLLKLTPALLVIWYALKREFRVVAIAVLTIIVAGPVSDTIVFGPERAAAQYTSWVRRSAVGSSQRALILEQREMDWRNQATGAVLTRWLHRTSYATRFENDPRWPHLDEKPQYFNVANLPLPALATLHSVLTGLCVAGLIWLARRPARKLSVWQMRFEWALFLLAMLWLMPVMRRYHVILAFPALSLLAAGLHYARHRGWWARLTGGCLALLVGLHITLLLLHNFDALEPVEARGTLLAGTFLLGVPVIGVLLWLRRDPGALPQPDVAQASRL